MSTTDKGSFPDWAILALGAVFGVCSVVMPSIPTAVGVVAGLLVVAVAVWDMWLPTTFSVAGEAASGLVVFLLPWFGGFAGSSGSWLSWILGILVILCAAWSWAAHPAHPSR